MKFKILRSQRRASWQSRCRFRAAAKPVYGDWGYNSAAMDSSVKPGDDFWAYVNGTLGQEAPRSPPTALRRPRS